MRSWTKKNNLLFNDVDLLLVPVLMDLCHWVLAVVNVPDQSFTFYDPYLVADDGGIFSTLRCWLQDEVADQLGTAVADEWAVDTWPSVGVAHFPRQADSSSCGVFSLVVADHLAVGAAPTFTQQDIPLLRRRLAMALYDDDLTIGPDLQALPEDN